MHILREVLQIRPLFMNVEEIIQELCYRCLAHLASLWYIPSKMLIKTPSTSKDVTFAANNNISR